MFLFRSPSTHPRIWWSEWRVLRQWHISNEPAVGSSRQMCFYFIQYFFFLSFFNYTFSKISTQTEAHYRLGLCAVEIQLPAIDWFYMIRNRWNSKWERQNKNIHSHLWIGHVRYDRFEMTGAELSVCFFSIALFTILLLSSMSTARHYVCNENIFKHFSVCRFRFNFTWFVRRFYVQRKSTLYNRMPSALNRKTFYHRQRAKRTN